MKSDFFIQGRIQNLDALRCFAFLAVFMEHLSLNVPEEIRSEEFKTLMHFVWIRGYLGVNFFFVLSGFLISGRLMDEFARNGKLDLVAYFRRRALRIMPMFLLMLFLAYQLSDFFYGKEEEAPLLPFLLIHSNMWMFETGLPKNALLSHLWSLSLEEQFYLLAPILVTVVAWFRFRKWFVMVLWLGCVAFRAWYFPSYGHIYFHSITLMADFLTGVLLAMMIREENVLINKIRNLKRIDIMFIYLLGILVICYPKFDFIAPMGYISRAIYALFFAFILAHQTLHQDRFLHADRISYAKEAGLISYGLYIFHPLGILLAGKIYLSMSIEFSNGFIHLLAHGITGMFLTVLLARAGESGTERLKALFYRDHR